MITTATSSRAIGLHGHAYGVEELTVALDVSSLFDFELRGENMRLNTKVSLIFSITPPELQVASPPHPTPPVQGEVAVWKMTM